MDGATAERETGAVHPIRVALSISAAALAYFLPLGLAPSAQATLTVLVAAALLWITEALPLGATALAVPLLGTALGAADAKTAFSAFGNPVVFMFLGTFLLTDAIAAHGLDRRLTDSVMASPRLKRSPATLLWVIALIGCVVSGWISNTATTALLLPLALSASRLGSPAFLTSVLLIAAYAPTLGGLATPVGTAPNIIGRGLISEYTGTEISFAKWMLMFAPLALVATGISALWLQKRAGPLPKQVAGTDTQAAPAPRRPWSLAERTLLPLLFGVILLWIVPGALASSPLQDEPWVVAWRTHLPEELVPLLGGVLLFVLPSGARTDAGHSRAIADGGALARVDWSTILLFGGGISLAAMMQASGLAKALGVAIFAHMPISGAFGITLAAAVVAVLVSELTSNTASASLVIPVVIELARAANVDPVGPALAATIACSFGFMLPISTPPNALIYGTGKIAIKDMVRCGVLLDVGGAILVAAWVTLVW